MKLLMKLIALGLIVSSGPLAVAKNSQPKKVKSNRTTEAHFNGSTVNGKYIHSPEAQVSVEKDKKLISVVKPRKNFKFQLKKSLEDYK